MVKKIYELSIFTKSSLKIMFLEDYYIIYASSNITKIYIFVFV